MVSGLTLSLARREAARCLLCEDPPCAAACPADSGPDSFIRKLRMDNLHGAWLDLKERNIMAGCAGQMCPAGDLCQSACTAGNLDRPIEIAALQSFLVNWGWEQGLGLPGPGSELNLRVGIIGGGPAGLAAAAELARAGARVRVLEARASAGGILSFGVPAHKLNPETLVREVEDVRSLGVEILCNQSIGNPAELLGQGFDRIILATGSLQYTNRNPEPEQEATKPLPHRTRTPGIYQTWDHRQIAPSLLVTAIRDGKEAARALLADLEPRLEVREVRKIPEVMAEPSLEVEFCGITMRNPVMLSSSPVSNSAEMISRAFDQGFAGVCFKTIKTDLVPLIHPSPRMGSLDFQGSAMAALQNVEQISDRPMEDNFKDLAWLKRRWPDRLVAAGIMGFRKGEWALLARRAEDAGADLLELNFSCPHMTVEGTGMDVGQAFELVRRYTEEARQATSLPIMAKLTPNITDMVPVARYARQGGADAISAINTVAGLTGLDVWNRRPLLNVFGKGAATGMSGPGIRPIGLRFISDLARAPDLNLPLSGIGGIETWRHALEYLLCGATTVQLTTGVIRYGYRVIEDILEGLNLYLKQTGIRSIREVIRGALPNFVEPGEFDVKRQGKAVYDLERCIGCGQCFRVCRDAGSGCLSWSGTLRRPVMDETRCLSCMICSFACPVDGLIRYQEVPGRVQHRPAPLE